MPIENVLQFKPVYMAAVGSNGEIIGDRHRERDLPEAQRMKRRVDAYLNGPGRLLQDYLGRQIPLIGGAEALPSSAVAGHIRINGLDLILANHNYESRVESMAAQYGIPSAWAHRLALDHEHAHAQDPHRETSSRIDAERYVERTLTEFYTSLAEKTTGNEQKKYHTLASVTKHRLDALNKMSGEQYGKMGGQLHDQQLQGDERQYSQRQGKNAQVLPQAKVA